MTRIAFQTPQTLVSRLIDLLPVGSMVPVWGLSTLQYARAAPDGPQYVLIVGANRYNDDVIAVPLIELDADGTHVVSATIVGAANWPGYAGPGFANLNDDGVLDVVIGVNGGHNPEDPIGGEPIRVALSGTSGAYLPVTVDGSRNYMHSWDVGDLDRNGWNDLVAMNIFPGGALSAPTVFLNEGGGFTSHPELLPDTMSSAQAWSSRPGIADFYQYSFLACKLADLNNDGWLDAVLPQANAFTFTDDFDAEVETLPGIGVRNVPGQVWINDGTGHLERAADLPVLRAGPANLAFSAALAIADIDGDGWQDIIYAASAFDPRTGNYAEYFDDTLVRVLVNDGHGGFVDESERRIAADGQQVAGAYANRVEVTDLDHDGSADIVVFAGQPVDPSDPQQFAQTFSYYLNDGTGHFTSHRVLVGDDFSGNYTLADVNADGILDVLYVVDVQEQADFIPDERVPGGWAGAGRLMVAYGEIAEDRVVTGSGGDDVLAGGGGDDRIDGGAGLDVLAYAGARSNYVVTPTDSGVVVRDRFASDGTDTAVNVERLRFSDSAVAFDLDGHAGQAYRLYKAAFDRAPDLPGLGYQINDLDVHLTLLQVAGNFIASPEFQSTYGPLGDDQFVRQLYLNVLDREPEADGLAYHLARLESGVSRAAILIGFSESPENQANVFGSISNGIEFVV